MVYLDSSDISVLSNPKTRTPEIIEIENNLLELQRKQLIEFRFSHIHIIEAAPVSAEAIMYSRQRFAYIDKLCKKKCLVSYIKILENEISKLTVTPKTNELTIYNDSSEWFPDIDLEGLENPNWMLETVNQAIESLPNTKSKRKARELYFDKNGILKIAVLKSLAEKHGVLKEFTDKYPFTKEEAAFYLHALYSGNSNDDLKKVLKNSFGDVLRLSDWYQKQWDRVLPISYYLRDIGTDVKSSIDDISKRVREFNDKIDSINNNQIKQNQKLLFDDLLKTIPKGVAEKIAANLNLKINADNISWTTTPGLLTTTTIYCHLARKTVFSSGTSRSARVSDFGDVSHAYYLPYVDIFRADSFIASTISESKLPFKTDVVGNLNQLVDVIQRRITASKIS